jgi:filamentous hemagglutinin family protein
MALFVHASPTYARPLFGGANASAAVTSAVNAAMASVQQAQQATVQSRNSLSAAVRAIQAMQGVQTAAHNAAAASGGGVPNGLTAGGLVVAPNATSDSNVWQGASLPTQSSNNGQTTVTVVQNQQKAILTWSSFNIGANTTLYFNQSAGNQTNGNNDWIALNRIIDPSLAPSQILGQIKAEGSVYLINGNGIIFGGSSQIDVHTLIASSLGFLGENVTSNMVPGPGAYDNAVSATNAAFLNATNGGIAAAEASGNSGNVPNLVLGVGGQVSSYVPTGAVTVEAGANISTHSNGSQSDGGFVLLAAPTVNKTPW